MMPLKETLLWPLVLLLAGLTGCGGTGSNPSPSPSTSSSHLVYVSVPSGNTISAFRVNNSNGNFASVVGSPFPAGNSPGAMLVHTSNQFLYVVNRTEDTVSLFDINQTVGSITEVLPRVATG